MATIDGSVQESLNAKLTESFISGGACLPHVKRTRMAAPAALAHVPLLQLDSGRHRGRNGQRGSATANGSAIWFTGHDRSIAVGKP
jgi:hypothetical protein